MGAVHEKGLSQGCVGFCGELARGKASRCNDAPMPIAGEKVFSTVIRILILQIICIFISELDRFFSMVGGNFVRVVAINLVEETYFYLLNL